MSLIDLLTEDVVKVPLAAAAKSDVLKELVGILADAGKIGDPGGIYDAVLSREMQCSTGLENGIAIPHAKTGLVATQMLALGISPGGIPFDAADGKVSKIFFLLLAPPDQPGPHIEVLSEIAKITRSPAFLNLLTGAVSAHEAVEIFRED